MNISFIAFVPIFACARAEWDVTLPLPIELAEIAPIASGEGIGKRLAFQITAKDGKSIPYALLEIKKPDWGSILIQADDGGTVSIYFEEDAMLTNCSLSARWLPPGTLLAKESVRSLSAPVDGYCRIIVGDRRLQ